MASIDSMAEAAGQARTAGDGAEVPEAKVDLADLVDRVGLVDLVDTAARVARVGTAVDRNRRGICRMRSRSKGSSSPHRTTRGSCGR